jgi:hypothetical protein
MARTPQGYKLRLESQDEYPHTPDAASNYNESMYFNVFDPKRKVGGWFRIGNRPNEGYAEITVCLYLPDRRVAFTFGRPKISGNTEMNAGGLKIDVVEPFKRLRLTYAGKVVLLDRPHEMADPSKAFRENPKAECVVDLDYEGVSPMMGGETVKEDGSPIEIDPEKSFARAHYEQHMRAKGVFVIGGERYEVEGLGLRDKSWGPRHWQAVNWYRWCPMNFTPEFAMMISVAGDGQGGLRGTGMVLKDGVYDYIRSATLDTDWDKNGYQTALRSHVVTESGAEYDVSGEVLSLIPLRNRRTTPEGQELMTRITEGMTEYRCGDLVGYGLSEYLDQIVDGRPTGADVPADFRVAGS